MRDCTSTMYSKIHVGPNVRHALPGFYIAAGILFSTAFQLEPKRLTARRRKKRNEWRNEKKKTVLQTQSFTSDKPELQPKPLIAPNSLLASPGKTWVPQSG